MKDYGAMSDFEINRAVAIKLKMTCIFPKSASPVVGVLSDECYINYDPCNSWSDAGPIIQKYRISISFDGSDDGDEYSEWVAACSLNEEHFVDYQQCDKALRAAMIVFLMMQESK